MSRLFGVLIVGVCFLSPVAARADDHDRHDAVATHEWSEHETEPWHRYLQEKHKKDHDWEKASKREKKEYWKWRDAHRD